MLLVLAAFAGATGWTAYEMRTARISFEKHAFNMAGVMQPVNRFVSIFLQPQGDRASTPMIYKWIDDYETAFGTEGRLFQMDKWQREVEKRVINVETNLDRILELVDPKERKKR